MEFEKRVEELGLEIPDYTSGPYPYSKYGTMKPHHISGSLLFLGGQVPELPDGTVLHPGRVGEDVSIEQGYEAARLSAINCLGNIRLALGNLDRVGSVVRTLNFVKCSPDFDEIGKVANGSTDLLRDVFGEERGLGARASIGVVSLSSNVCFENWLTLEIAP